MLDIDLSKAKVPVMIVNTSMSSLQAHTAAAVTSFVIYNSGYQVFVPFPQIHQAL